jgi:hypothetical protein
LFYKYSVSLALKLNGLAMPQRSKIFSVPGMLLIYRVEVPKEPNDRNPIAESKGVLGDRESEGSRRQKIDETNRNRI